MLMSHSVPPPTVCPAQGTLHFLTMFARGLCSSKTQMLSAPHGAFSCDSELISSGSPSAAGPLTLLAACLSSSFLPRPWYPTATVFTFPKQTGFGGVSPVGDSGHKAREARVQQTSTQISVRLHAGVPASTEWLQEGLQGPRGDIPRD